MNFFKRFSNNFSRNQGEDTWDNWIREDKEKKLKEEKKLEEEKKLIEEAEKKRLEAMTLEEIEAEQNNKKLEADTWKEYLLKQFNEHRFVLYEEWDNSWVEDQYGNMDSEYVDYQELADAILYDLNENSPGFNSGFNYFFKRVIMRDISASDFNKGWRNYEKFYKPKNVEGNDQTWWGAMSDIFLDVMRSTCEEVIKKEEERTDAGYSDDMTGEEYEVYCGNILIQEGWNVEQTSKTNDQGVDLIGSISDLKICIQCKRYSNPVGNKAVQEIIAGKQFYSGTHAVVVSNAGFTKSAETLAKKTGVILISDLELENLEDYIE